MGLGLVVPGVVLAQRREVVEQRAIGQHRLQTEHRAAEGAVAQEAEAARVGGEVASDLARALVRARARGRPRLGVRVKARARVAVGVAVGVGVGVSTWLGLGLALALTLTPTLSLTTLAPRSRGMVKRRAATCCWSVSRTQPASHVRLPAVSSSDKMRLIRESDSTTSSPMGTLPPTRPVLPPCGTTGSRRAWQCARMRETSCVLPGRSASALWPRYLPIQSVLNGSSSVGEVMAWPAPTLDAKCCTSSSDRRE